MDNRKLYKIKLKYGETKTYVIRIVMTYDEIMGRIAWWLTTYKSVKIEEIKNDYVL